MSHRQLSGKMACGLSKWGQCEGKRIIYSCVDLVVVFAPLVTHFKCQRTLFGMCQNAPCGDGEDVTALTDWDGSFRGSFGIASWIWTKLGKGMVFLFTWECWKEKVSRECALSGGGRSCVMAGVRVQARKAKEKDSQHYFICLGVGWCKQTQSLCKLLILWTVKSSLWKQEKLGLTAEKEEGHSRQRLMGKGI